MRKANQTSCFWAVGFIIGQAIRRKVLQMPELFQKIQNYLTNDIFRRLQCLPLLPPEHIEL